MEIRIRPLKEHCYDHATQSVETSHEIRVTKQAQTDKTIPNNKPDIIIRDNEKGTCMLIVQCEGTEMRWRNMAKRLENTEI